MVKKRKNRYMVPYLYVEDGQAFVEADSMKEAEEKVKSGEMNARNLKESKIIVGLKYKLYHEKVK